MNETTLTDSGLSWKGILEFLGNNGIDSSTIVEFGKNVVIALETLLKPPESRVPLRQCRS